MRPVRPVRPVLSAHTRAERRREVTERLGGREGRALAAAAAAAAAGYGLYTLYSPRATIAHADSIRSLDEFKRMQAAWTLEAERHKKSDTPESKFALATLMYEGRGYVLNRREALVLFESAAVKGNADAQFAMGELYEFGHLFDGKERQDLVVAANWYRLALKEASTRLQAQEALRAMHGKHEPSVRRDTWMDSTRVYLRMEADSGTAGAAAQYGAACESMRSPLRTMSDVAQKDLADDAEQYYRKALAQDTNDHEVQFRLASLLRTLGKESEAKELMAQSAENGNAAALLALEQYAKAADAGNIAAHVLLAEQYKNKGRPDAALKVLTAAEKIGSVSVLEALWSLYDDSPTLENRDAQLHNYAFAAANFSPALAQRLLEPTEHEHPIAFESVLGRHAQGIGIVDPAGMYYIRNGPKGAGGASGAIYAWLQMDQFPAAVTKAVTAECMAAFHAHGEKGVIHVASPDLTDERSYSSALSRLTTAYTNVLTLFRETSELLQLRIPPLSSGVFAGTWKASMPELTARALHAATIETGANPRTCTLCVFEDFGVAVQYRHALINATRAATPSRSRGSTVPTAPRPRRGRPGS